MSEAINTTANTRAVGLVTTMTVAVGNSIVKPIAVSRHHRSDDDVSNKLYTLPDSFHILGNIEAMQCALV